MHCNHGIEIYLLQGFITDVVALQVKFPIQDGLDSWILWIYEIKIPLAWVPKFSSVDDKSLKRTKKVAGENWLLIKSLTCLHMIGALCRSSNKFGSQKTQGC